MNTTPRPTHAKTLPPRKSRLSIGLALLLALALLLPLGAWAEEAETPLPPAAVADHDHPYNAKVVDNGGTISDTTGYVIYNVYTDQDLLAINWDNIKAGTLVNIHYKEQPYRVKFAINAEGTRARQIIIRGIADASGKRPVIDGANARSANSGFNVSRGLVVIGNANENTSYITVEGLEIRGARPGNVSYAKESSEAVEYAKNACGIWFLAGRNVTVRDCDINTNGNGLFSYVPTYDLLVEYNKIHNNGISRSMFEHNSYCATIGTTYQYNEYGPLYQNAHGYGLKDRGAQTVIRYNTITGGRRQISLDDGEDSPIVPADPGYHDSFVYGNLLVEQDDGMMRLWGDDEIISYGGDNGDVPDRSGTLFFYNNTVISYRQAYTYKEGDKFVDNNNQRQIPVGRIERTGIFTTPAEVELEDGSYASLQKIDARNNIFAAMGPNPAPIGLLALNGGLHPDCGMAVFHNNLIYSPNGWQISYDEEEYLSTGVSDQAVIGIADGALMRALSLGTNLVSDPMLDDAYKLQAGSPAIDGAGGLSALIASAHPVNREPLGATRILRGARLDIGAFER